MENGQFTCYNMIHFKSVTPQTNHFTHELVHSHLLLLDFLLFWMCGARTLNTEISLPSQYWVLETHLQLVQILNKWFIGFIIQLMPNTSTHSSLLLSVHPPACRSFGHKNSRIQSWCLLCKPRIKLRNLPPFRKILQSNSKLIDFNIDSSAVCIWRRFYPQWFTQVNIFLLQTRWVWKINKAPSNTR